MHVSIGMLTKAASYQPMTALTTTRGTAMTAELTHEEEFLIHLSTAGAVDAAWFAPQTARQQPVPPTSRPQAGRLREHRVRRSPSP